MDDFRVINRIVFPAQRDLDLMPLFFKIQENYKKSVLLSFDEKEKPKIYLQRGNVLSLNTYFNSFFERLWCNYAVLAGLSWNLYLEGDFMVSVYDSSYSRDKRLLVQINVSNYSLSRSVNIPLPPQDIFPRERIFLEIECLSRRGIFAGGELVSSSNPVRNVSLGIIICTFKREQYIREVLSTIAKEPAINHEHLQILVIDNAATLSREALEDLKLKVEVYPNRNVGGAGGFTRGLLELYEKNSNSHFVFMDDDIKLIPEVILRLIRFYEFAKEDNIAVSGSMLNLYKGFQLWEAGALYETEGPFSIFSLKHGVDLKEERNLDIVAIEEKPHYGAWWFFSFPKKTVLSCGLPMPYFVRGDDIEYGLRMSKKGVRILALPGIAVWHEPFYAKPSTWHEYYIVRNHLITDSLHPELTVNNYFPSFFVLTKRLFSSLFVFDYNRAALLMKALEDFLSGPDFLKSVNPENIHSEVLKLNNEFRELQIEDNFSISKHQEPLGKESLLIRLIRYLSLNGHFLPNFFLSQKPVIIDAWEIAHRKAFRAKKCLRYSLFTRKVYVCEMNRIKALKILLSWVRLLLKSAFNWRKVQYRWRQGFAELTSVDFWKKYLGLYESR